MDATGSACCLQAKVWRGMLKKTLANVKQELMLVPILFSQPVDPKKVQVALKATPQVVKVVTRLPPKTTAF